MYSETAVTIVASNANTLVPIATLLITSFIFAVIKRFFDKN